jgi:hypothetical protein
MIKTSNSHKLVKRLPMLLFFILFAALAHAQDPSATFDDPNMQKPDSKSQKALAKKKKQREKEANKATKALLKQHMKDQSPATRKRMKQDAKEAQRNNEHKREFFLKRWFRKKHASG